MPLWTPYIQEVPLDLSVKTDAEPREQLNRGFSSLTTQPNSPHILHPGFSVSTPPYSPYNSGNIQSIPAHTASFAQSPPTSPDDLELDEEYAAFEREQLSAIAGRNGGSLVSNNPRMRRTVHGNEVADEAYRSHRLKNNYAAKQSRDRRKMRQILLSIKVAYLTKKLAELKTAVGVCDDCRPRPTM